MDLYTQLCQDIKGCQRCTLSQSRQHVVVGEGSLTADVMLIGEGPGADEDRLGRPFVGRAGQLLDRILEAVDINREEIYIANILKCRPPGNRNPQDGEAHACLPYLRRQVKIIRPKILVCMGSVAAKYIIDPDAKISRIRGQFIERKGFYLFGTYHPAALLRNERLKVDAWHDFKAIKAKSLELKD